MRLSSGNDWLGSSVMLLSFSMNVLGDSGGPMERVAKELRCESLMTTVDIEAV